jgi:fucose permease
MVSFVLNGLGFASWASRIPEIRSTLSLSNAALGLLLLLVSVGSVVTMSSAGPVIERLGPARVVRLSLSLNAAALASAGLAVEAGSYEATALCLVFLGGGVGVWDVAMNVEGATVETALGRSIMPRFHAGFSFGTVLGAGLGAAASALDVPIGRFLLVPALAILVIGHATTGGFLGMAPDPEAGSDRSSGSAWREPHTLLIGLLVLSLALVEGTANDWLAVALIDGYGVERWVGVAGFGAFVTAMTLGRLGGPPLLDRYGRVRVLRGTIGAAVVGILMVVFGGQALVIVSGIMLWGVGASLGFPIGMSAAADDPVRAARRVSVVSTIAYTAFFVGPPLLGFLADHVGTLHSLIVVAIALVPSLLVVPVARESTRS